MDAQTTKHKPCVQELHTNRFIQNSCMNLNTIKQLCHEQVTNLNFDYVSYVGYYPVCEETHEISTFPDEWRQVNRSYYECRSNPIATLSQNRTTPFLWQNCVTDSSSDKVNLDYFLKTAQKHNIHNGICFPIHGAGAEWGMLNIARSVKLQNVSLDSVQFLQLYALSVHEAVKKANACHIKENAKQKTLSPRECECLNWIAAGKTAWETAKIIGITESTVSFHVRNTIIKLNANNRAQAVAVAMARSLISNPHNEPTPASKQTT